MTFCKITWILGLKWYFRHTNRKIIQLCINLGMPVIDNSNITIHKLARDGLHLNSAGIQMFANNLSAFFRNIASPKIVRTPATEWKRWLQTVATVSRLC